LAIITENSGRRKRKTLIPIGSSTAENQNIVKLERKMDAFEEFRKFWEPMLQKWDSYIEEMQEAELASEDEGDEGE
jgi:hypothetical protein